MAKFVIECPSCHRFAEARTGFFARKRIDCACGNVINVRTDSLSSRKCPNCGNQVVYDQRQGDSANCPVCHAPINTVELQAKNVAFNCRQCGVELLAPKGSVSHTCPVCDCVNDVAERVKLAQIAAEEMASLISYEGDAETLVWKHPVENFNYGSQLIVRASQEAVFLKDGRASDPLRPGRYAVGTERIPELQEAIQYTPIPGGHFQSQVYFINKATQMAIKWGTDSKVRLFDPMTGMPADLGASGDFNIRICDSVKFLLKIVGTTDSFTQEKLSHYFKSLIVTRVKSHLAATIKAQKISVFELDEHLMELSDALRAIINPALLEYGLELSEFQIARFVFPEDEGFKEAARLFREEYLKNRQAQIRRQVDTTEARTDAELKMIRAQTDAEIARLQGATEAENYRLKAYAEAEEMRMKGYSYRDETTRAVSIEAMKNGIPSSGVSGVVGEMAGIGMSVGVMNGVRDMTREAIAQTAAPTGWNCSCGHQNITTNFCPHCGSPKQATGWSCPNCGRQSITTNFCPDCGNAKPNPNWNCPNCGQQSITTNFCPNCGQRRG